MAGNIFLQQEGQGEKMGQRLNEYDKVVKLYELYEQKMYRIAYSVLNNQWQAEDAVSEAFIKIMKNLSKIRDVESDKTKKFIIRIIQNTSIDYYRKNQKERAVFTVVSDEEQEHFPSPGNSVDDMLKDMDSQEEVNRLLSVLPEKYREVLLYRCVHELSVKETAAVLEISDNLVKKRYERARNMLMKKLGDEQYEYKVI